MRRHWKNILYFGVLTCLMVRLIYTYGWYSACAQPIHHWFLGLLIFLFVFRILLLCINSMQVGNLVLMFLGCLIGPSSIIFMLVWNILGTIYIIDIAKQDNMKKCIYRTTLVLVIIVISFVYLFYLILILAIISFIQKKRNIKNEKSEIKANLIIIYKEIIKEKYLITLEEANQLKKEIHLLIDKKCNILKNFEMFEEEKKVMSMFFIPGMLEHPDRLSRLSMSQLTNPLIKTSNMDSIKSAPLLSDPLLQMIGKDRFKKKVEKRITTIRKNIDNSPNDCIICYSSLKNHSMKIVLKCDHCFHTTCLFDWLKINPSCPFCRTNFRINLLNAILTYLDQIIQIKTLENNHNNSTPLLGEYKV